MSIKNTISVQAIRKVLQSCIDPELGIDIVSLGLVYAIEVTKEQVLITMTLTTPGCPLAPYFQRRVTELVQQVLPNSTVEIHFTFEPPWSPERMSADGKRTLTMLRG